ncbi:MAG: carboxypeptidase regulatory-like domain-containing protein, partial [Gemmatimonadota bacterium]
MDLQFRTPLGRVLGAWVLALALLTLAAGALTAQQGAVAGRVTDAGTGLPLSGVLIQVVGTALGAVTSPAGEYRVANISPGEVELRANMLGYSPATRFVS